MKRTPLLRKPDTKARLELKAKPCKNCRTPFIKVSAWQKYCRAEACGVAAAEEARAKREREEKRQAVKEKREDRKKLEALKPLSYFEAKAQDAINWYVKERDRFKGCASCDLPASWDGQWHASHFRSVGAATAVRYHLWNVHKACVGCNHFKSGNLAEYEPRLRLRIGDEKVDWLKTQNQVVKYTREYLQRLQRVFNKKARRQEKRNAAAL